MLLSFLLIDHGLFKRQCNPYGWVVHWVFFLHALVFTALLSYVWNVFQIRQPEEQTQRQEQTEEEVRCTVNNSNILYVLKVYDAGFCSKRMHRLTQKCFLSVIAYHPVEVWCPGNTSCVYLSRVCAWRSCSLACFVHTGFFFVYLIKKLHTTHGRNRPDSWALVFSFHINFSFIYLYSRGLKVTYKSYSRPDSAESSLQQLPVLQHIRAKYITKKRVNRNNHQNFIQKRRELTEMGRC